MRKVKVNVSFGGFTLIEIMMVVAITILLFGGSIASFISFNNRQTVVGDAKILLSELKKTQSTAINMVYPTGCTSLVGYRITGSATGKIITSVAVCGNGDYTVDSNITALENSHFVGNFNVLFQASSGLVTSGDGVIQINGDGTGDVYQVDVRVETNGNINDDVVRTVTI